MDETTFKILETLSENIGHEMSIKQLTEEIQRVHGSAHYANIYDKVQQMSKDKMISLGKAGNTYRISLNFYDYWIVDILTQMEIIKKQKMLGAYPRILQLLSNVENIAAAMPSISSISAIRPIKYEAVNRLELLVLIRDGIPSDAEEASRISVDYSVRLMQHGGGTKIDSLVLRESEIGPMLSTKEKTPAKEMIGDKLVFVGAQNFWRIIKDAIEEGLWVRAESQETIPSKTNDLVLGHNMARLGYKEMGRTVKPGEDYCVEFVVAAMMARGQARLVEAVPVILSNWKPNYNVLFFLAKKFRLLEMFMAVLEAVSIVLPQHKRNALDLIRVLKDMQIEPAMTLNANSIGEKIRLYRQTG